MANNFPVRTDIPARVLQTESVMVGNNFNSYSGSAGIAINTTMVSGFFRSVGGFNIWLKKIFIKSDKAMKGRIQIKSSGGIADLDAVVNVDMTLQAGVTWEWEYNGLVPWGANFIFTNRGITDTSGNITVDIGYDGLRIFQNKNYLSPKCIKIIGDSISVGANSTTTGDDPHLSWFAQTVYKYYGLTNDVKGVNKAVGGITADAMDKARKWGWCNCDNANLIFIALGTNTSSTVDLFEDSIQNILNQELLYHPNAKVVLCAPIVRDDATETVLVEYRERLQQIYDGSDHTKVFYARPDSLGIVSGVGPAQVHPDQTGHNEIFDYMVSFLEGNNITI